MRYNGCSYEYSLLFKYLFTMLYYVWRNPEDTIYLLSTPEDLQEGPAVRGHTRSITLRVTR
jgi:hypothetical protein